MKNIVKFLALALILSLSVSTYAQKKQKFGHIDSNQLMKLMPGRDSAQAKIEDYAKKLESQLKGMQAEFEKKYNDYTVNEKNMTDLIKQTNAQELTDLQKRIEAFQQSAQDELQKKQDELLKPIVDKAKSAIEKVAKDNGYTYIFDAGLGVLLYNDPTEDVLPLVKKELGIN
jgi:outer membrane protein